jgi:hypothetical protein
MPAQLRIQDGNPVWLSASIVPSRDAVVSPNSSPRLATVQVGSTDVFVYVDVENPGTVDLGLCPCSAPVPAAWVSPPAFSGFLDSTTQSLIDNNGAFVFEARPFGQGGDRITGPGGFNKGLPWGNGRRTWGWSPDGRMFAYVFETGNSPSSSGESSWSVGVIALQPITLLDGTIAPIGAPLAVAIGSFDGVWTQAQFGWAGSQAVVAHGGAWDSFAHFFLGAPNSEVVTIVCPLAPPASLPGGAIWSGTKSFSTVITGTPPYPTPIPHQDRVNWMYLVSPCGSYVAVVPRILDPSAPPQTIVLVATANAQEVTFRRNNVGVLAITGTGTNPSITTNMHAALGVTINTGDGTTVDVDDPECTFVGGGVIVRVDRVKASTLPTANLGVLPIGTAVLGAVLQNGFRWVQVPNQNGWANQSEKHWCLLAQAYTGDATTIPRAWDGQATNPPPFPIANENCAQRNIEIDP